MTIPFWARKRNRPGAPPKSTLAYANANRPWQLYRAVFRSLLARCHHVVARHGRKFRFKNKLVSLDSTTISLCLSLFPWAKFRRAKGGVKAHVLLDHDDYLPAYVLITEAKRHDSKVLSLLRLAAGSIIVMDKACNVYEQFAAWCLEGVFFVTRMKDNAIYEVVERKDVPQHRHILSDAIIRLTGARAEEKCPHLLRRIVVWDEEHEREIVLLTNHMEFGATTLAAIYRERWQNELFFKALKQNLKVKSFVGVSENALRIQIWTALIALLLLKWLHHLSKASWSLSNLASLLRLNLFTYRDLMEWLHDPFHTPPLEPVPQQLDLALAQSGHPRVPQEANLNPKTVIHQRKSLILRGVQDEPCPNLYSNTDNSVSAESIVPVL